MTDPHNISNTTSHLFDQQLWKRASNVLQLSRLPYVFFILIETIPFHFKATINQLIEYKLLNVITYRLYKNTFLGLFTYGFTPLINHILHFGSVPMTSRKVTEAIAKVSWMFQARGRRPLDYYYSTGHTSGTLSGLITVSIVLWFGFSRHRSYLTLDQAIDLFNSVYVNLSNSITSLYDWVFRTKPSASVAVGISTVTSDVVNGQSRSVVDMDKNSTPISYKKELNSKFQPPYPGQHIGFIFKYTVGMLIVGIVLFNITSGYALPYDFEPYAKGINGIPWR